MYVVSQSLTQTFNLVQNGCEIVKSHPSQPLDVHIDFRQGPLQIVALSRLLRPCSSCSPFLGGVPHSAKGALHVTPRPVRLAARLSPRRRRCDFLRNSGCRLRGKESSAHSTVNGIAGQNLWLRSGVESSSCCMVNISGSDEQLTQSQGSRHDERWAGWIAVYQIAMERPKKTGLNHRKL